MRYIAAQRPATLNALASPSGPPAWRSILACALVGTRDRVLPPAEQIIMANRARAHIVKVNALAAVDDLPVPRCRRPDQGRGSGHPLMPAGARTAAAAYTQLHNEERQPRWS